MKSGALQFALRETRAILGNRMVLGGLAVAIVILTLSGPFGTDDQLSPAPRAAYWAAVVVLTYAAGVLVNHLFEASGKGAGPWRIMSILVTALAATLIVLALNHVTFERTPLGIHSGWFVTLEILVVAVLVSVGLYAWTRPAPATDEPAPRPPALLQRLPLDKRGALVAISVQDHYVQVMTTRGHDLVLMRLGDAIRETGDVPGLQVHRSHWVALDQIRAARRMGERAVLTMSDGQDIPVSRTYLPAVKTAGLLPKGKDTA